MVDIVFRMMVQPRSVRMTSRARQTGPFCLLQKASAPVCTLAVLGCAKPKAVLYCQVNLCYPHNAQLFCVYEKIQKKLIWLHLKLCWFSGTFSQNLYGFQTRHRQAFVKIRKIWPVCLFKWSLERRFPFNNLHSSHHHETIRIDKTWATMCYSLSNANPQSIANCNS